MAGALMHAWTVDLVVDVDVDLEVPVNRVRCGTLPRSFHPVYCPVQP